MEKLIIRPAKTTEWEAAMELAFRVFLKYEANEYGKAGTDAFRSFIADEMLKKLFEAGHYKLFLAFVKDELAGIITIRSGNHLSLLFVEEKYHRRGIGSGLLFYAENYVKENDTYDCITVNAAPYATDFYHKLGFNDMGEEISQDNIIFTPMKKNILSNQANIMKKV